MKEEVMSNPYGPDIVIVYDDDGNVVEKKTVKEVTIAAGGKHLTEEDEDVV